MVAGGGGGSVVTGSNVYGKGGILTSNNSSGVWQNVTYVAYGATQIKGGYGNTGSVSGSFGQGANGGSTYRAGGGGGYYGGGVATYRGSGGSSFMSGYAGANAITSSTSRTHTNNTIHYSGKYFIDGKMQSGVNSTTGKAIITYIGEKPERVNTDLDNIRYIKDCINGSSANTGNHWVELQAIKDGVNLAKGIIPTGTVAQTSTTYSYTKITDGDITSANYASTSSAGNQCITIDLEENYDLDEIAIWHYWADGRSYNENHISVSSDNNIYKIVLNNTDNLVSETSNGIRISAY